MTEPTPSFRRESERDESDRRTEAVAEFVIPEGAETVRLRDLLFFTISGMSFCLPLLEITGVADVTDTLIVRDTTQELPKLCRGHLRYHRQEIPLLDLREKFGFARESLDGSAEALILDFGVTFFGLLVDYVFNVEGVVQGYRLTLPPNITGLGDEYLHGYIVYPGGGAYRLRTQTLLNDDDLEALSEVV